MTDFDKMISTLADQCILGNQMIAAGFNHKADHMAAWDAHADLSANELFSKHFSANGGGCKGLRALAAAWPDDRRSFIAVCVAHGQNAATAATQWNKGRKA